MRTAFGLLILVLLVGCSTNVNQSASVDRDIQVPEVEFKLKETVYDAKSSLWIKKSDSTLVSGRIVSYFPNGVKAKSIPVVEGKREGEQLTYFLDGQLRFLETYSNNKLDGVVKRWGVEEGYQLLAELNYLNGKLHGEQKKWYASGELHKLLQLESGKEEGMQKAYRKNGALYANYEAKNGRVFGLKRSNLCYELDNEQVVYIQ